MLANYSAKMEIELMDKIMSSEKINIESKVFLSAYIKGGGKNSIKKEGLKFLSNYGKMYFGITSDGRWLALSGGTVTLRLHRNLKRNLGKEG